MSEVFPVNDFGPAMPGLVMAAVAIVHVFLAQFAVGGGMLLCYFQWLAMTGRSEHARRFVDGYFKILVLVSFILGALTGVGIWLTSIQISPATIGAMVDNFHWLWAAEWTFFCLEVVAGYCFYRCHKRLDDRTSLKLLILYAFASWMSLFIINGILSWQLTPGRWVETHQIADGFFNPSFSPSLLFRTVVATTLSGLVACVVINTMTDIDRDGKRQLINQTARLLIPMVVMPFLGAWYLAVLPEDSRGWILGGSPAMMLFFSISVGASLAIGAYAIAGLVMRKLYINGATALLLLVLAFGATAGGEFVREGSRKPFSIRYVLYSNAILPEDVPRLRKVGCLAEDSYPLRNADEIPTPLLRTGALVFRRQCSICHTLEGTNAVAHLTGTWDMNQMRMNLAKLQHTKPFMPPFAGTAQELEAMVQFIRWTSAGRPEQWEHQIDEEKTLSQIQNWLDEAGTEPGSHQQ